MSLIRSDEKKTPLFIMGAIDLHMEKPEIIVKTAGTIIATTNEICPLLKTMSSCVSISLYTCSKHPHAHEVRD